jgi:hypothetical protein
MKTVGHSRILVSREDAVIVTSIRCDYLVHGRSFVLL